jgi:hydroxymethylbilane synthase
MKIKIGTRGSALAVWQARYVAEKLKKIDAGLETEIIKIKTRGDRDRNTSLNAFSSTGIFTKEIEESILNDQCHIGVHSFKDMATSMPEGLFICAVLKREHPADAFVSENSLPLKDIKEGSTIGTSSLRRAALLKKNRPDLKIVPLRGNVPTRLMAAGIDVLDNKAKVGRSVDGTILAFAGLKRLGFEKYATHALDLKTFLPAPAQGAIAVQSKIDNTTINNLVARLNHEATQKSVAAEREFLKILEGGCRLPIGALATIDNGQISLDGIVLSLDGNFSVRGITKGTDPLEVGKSLAWKLKQQGADEILNGIKSG